MQLKEFVKVNDSIYEVDPTQESGFRFSRLLPFKVRDPHPNRVSSATLDPAGSTET